MPHTGSHETGPNLEALKTTLRTKLIEKFTQWFLEQDEAPEDAKLQGMEEADRAMTGITIDASGNINITPENKRPPAEFLDNDDGLEIFWEAVAAAKKEMGM